MTFAFITLTLWENNDAVRVNVNQIVDYHRPKNMPVGRWLLAGRAGSYVITTAHEMNLLHVNESPEEIDELISKI